MDSIKYNENELAILKSLDSRYKWITRDKSKTLTVHTTEPCKDKNFEYWTSIDFADIEPFNHLFQYIKWTDKTAYSISGLIELIENAKINYYDVKKSIHEKNKQMLGNCMQDFL